MTQIAVTIMRINLSDDLRIVGTKHAWELQRRRTVKSKDRWRAFKWFPSFSSAVQEAVHAEIREYPVNDLAEAIKAVDTIVLLSDGSPTEIRGKTARKDMTAVDILDQIDTLNRFRRIQVHTFGVGKPIEEEGREFGAFLQELAVRNNGSYTAVD